MTLQEIQELIRTRGIRRVDLKVCDLFGRWQHFMLPAHRLSQDLFENGNGFDGSSLRGFQEIHESDMLLKPEPSTAFIDSMCEVPTLSMICDVFDPILGQPYSRDPRFVAKKAESYLKEALTQE